MMLSQPRFAQFVNAATVGVLVSAGATTARSFAISSQTMGPRFDGVYQSETVDKWSTTAQLEYGTPFVSERSRSYFRFFADGTVIVLSSIDEPEKFAKREFTTGHHQGTFTVDDGRISFTLHRCSLCPPETTFEGQIKGEQLTFRYDSRVERGLQGKRRGTFTANFIQVVASNSRSSTNLLGLDLSNEQIAEFEALTPMKVKPPKAPQLKALSTARTMRVVFDAKDSEGFRATEDFIEDYRALSMVEEFNRRAGLRRVDTGEADLVMKVDNLYETVDRVYVASRAFARSNANSRYGSPITLGRQLGGRVTIEIVNPRVGFVLEFTGSQRGPWFSSSTEKVVDSYGKETGTFVGYQQKAIQGNAFMEGFGRALKTILLFREMSP